MKEINNIEIFGESSFLKLEKNQLNFEITTNNNCCFLQRANNQIKSISSNKLSNDQKIANFKALKLFDIAKNNEEKAILFFDNNLLNIKTVQSFANTYYIHNILTIQQTASSESNKLSYLQTQIDSISPSKAGEKNQSQLDNVILCFDFDETLTNYHTNQYKLEDNELLKIGKFIKGFQDRGAEIKIISGNTENHIKSYLFSAFSLEENNQKTRKERTFSLDNILQSTLHSRRRERANTSPI